MLWLVWLWTMSHQVVLMVIDLEKCIPRLLLERANLLAHLFRVWRQLKKCTCNFEKRRGENLDSYSLITPLDTSVDQLSQLCALQVQNWFILRLFYFLNQSVQYLRNYHEAFLLFPSTSSFLCDDVSKIRKHRRRSSDRRRVSTFHFRT